MKGEQQEQYAMRPCPNCGGQGKLRETNGGNNRAVICSECGFYVNGETYDKTFDSAVEYWNWMAREEHIKPCPFCGKYEGDEDGYEPWWFDDVDVEEEDDFFPHSYYVKCNNCNARGPLMHDRRAAVTVWNRRESE